MRRLDALTISTSFCHLAVGPASTANLATPRRFSILLHPHPVQTLTKFRDRAPLEGLDRVWIPVMRKPCFTGRSRACTGLQGHQPGGCGGGGGGGGGGTVFIRYRYFLSARMSLVPVLAVGLSGQQPGLSFNGTMRKKLLFGNISPRSDPGIVYAFCSMEMDPPG